MEFASRTFITVWENLIVEIITNFYHISEIGTSRCDFIVAHCQQSCFVCWAVCFCFLHTFFYPTLGKVQTVPEWDDGKGNNIPMIMWFIHVVMQDSQSKKLAEGSKERKTHIYPKFQWLSYFLQCYPPVVEIIICVHCLHVYITLKIW